MSAPQARRVARAARRTFAVFRESVELSTHATDALT